jgi:hypothetical protein
MLLFISRLLSLESTILAYLLRTNPKAPPLVKSNCCVSTRSNELSGDLSNTLCPADKTASLTNKGDTIELAFSSNLPAGKQPLIISN